jgi:hypothetical protein
MKKLAWIVIIIGLFGVCAFIFFNYLIWRIPAVPETHAIKLADLDGDGDPDAFLANGRNEVPEPNTVLWNDGKGNFRDSGQRLGEFESWALALADFDHDGDSDALVSNISWGEYFWNDGGGQFKSGQQVYMPAKGEEFVGMWRFEPADLNEDGWIDLFSTGCCGGGRAESGDEWQTLNATNAIWLGDSDGLHKTGGQLFGLGNSEAAALGDLDGDGDLDAFLANSGHLDEDGEMVKFDVNEVWYNDGQGTFTDSYQQLGSQRSYAVALGDLDRDGDLDAFVGNRGPDEIWWNDGQGQFSVDEETFGDDLTRYVYLADLDQDEDLDAFLGSDKRGDIWWNDGRGHFSQSGQPLNYSARHAVTLGDVNGDGATDIVAGKLNGAIVWLNDGTGQMHK